MPANLATEGRPALVYLRPLPDADPPLGLSLQRAATSALISAEGYVAIETHQDTPNAAGLAGFTTLLDALATAAERPTVVLASAEVLGERALDRAERLLALLATGAMVRLADASTPEQALRSAWLGRAPNERRRERARESMRKRALRGQVLGRAPFGYAIEGRNLVVDDHEAAVVRRIFSLYLDGYEGVRRIARQLNEDGIHTRLGKPWSAGSVRAVLRNPTYTGTYRRLGIVVTGAHPALLRRGQFEEVQARMARRRTAPADQHRHAYLLAGLARCGHCGARLLGARRSTGGGEAKTYYRCASATNQGRCAYHSQRTEVLEAAVRDALVSGRLSVARKPPSPRTTEARRIALDREVARTLERWAAGELTYRDVVRRAGEPALEAVRLTTAAQAASPRLDAVTAADRLTAEWDSLEFAEKRALLLDAVAEVVVRDKRIRVTRRYEAT
ncbi:MAG: hypothetical protein C4558_02205 [Dehalococcoidia bacterium]|nr:MAG: hypothetical protein C4558_02205 [Dehalococcoidia bacterium]